MCHRSGCDRKTLPIRKSDDNTEKVSPRFGLAQDIVDRIATLSPSAKDKRLTKTDLLDFTRVHPVFGDM